MPLSALLERLISFIKEVLKLVDATEKNRSDIKDTQEQLNELSNAVRRLAYEIKRINERVADEREKDELRMENFKLEIEGQILRARLKDQEPPPDNEEK